MGFVSPELRRRVRLHKSKTVELEDGLITLRIAPCDGLKGFSLSSNMNSEQKADLLIGSVIKDNGDPFFGSRNNVEEYMQMLSLPEAVRLVREIIDLSAPAPAVRAEGKSDGEEKPEEPDSSPSESAP